MKKLLLLIMLFVCVVTIAFAAEVPYKPADEAEVPYKPAGEGVLPFKEAGVVFDFRKTNWGMSIEEVKKIEETKSIGEEKGCLYYQGKVSEFDCCIVYSFVENRLTETSYLFTHSHTNKNGYIEDYDKLRGSLIKKYGEPVKDKIIWENDLFKNSKQDWGTAISVGHLWYGVYWETPITEITMILMGDNYKINFSIMYRSQELKEWADKIKEERAKKDL